MPKPAVRFPHEGLGEQLSICRDLSLARVRFPHEGLGDRMPVATGCSIGGVRFPHEGFPLELQSDAIKKVVQQAEVLAWEIVF